MATQEFQLQEASSNMRNICSKVDYPIDPLQNPKPLYDFRHFTPHLQDLQHPRFQCEQQRWDAEAKTLPSILAKLEQVFNPDLSISLECLIHQRLPMKRQNIWVRKSNTPLCRERMKKVWPRGNTWIPQVPIRSDPFTADGARSPRAGKCQTDWNTLKYSETLWHTYSI